MDAPSWSGMRRRRRFVRATLPTRIWRALAFLGLGLCVLYVARCALPRHPQHRLRKRPSYAACRASLAKLAVNGLGPPVKNDPRSSSALPSPGALDPALFAGVSGVHGAQDRRSDDEIQSSCTLQRGMRCMRGEGGWVAQK